MNYACGFYISWDLKKFVMIKKNKPDWQENKYNGVGGKIERLDDGGQGHSGSYLENPKNAMAREFEEETGLLTHPSSWHCFHIENYKGISPDPSKAAKVYYFVQFGDGWSKVKSMTEGEIVILNYEDCTFAPNEFIFNIAYLWMMILSHVKNKTLLSLNPEGVNS